MRYGFVYEPNSPTLHYDPINIATLIAWRILNSCKSLSTPTKWIASPMIAMGLSRILNNENELKQLARNPEKFADELASAFSKCKKRFREALSKYKPLFEILADEEKMNSAIEKLHSTIENSQLTQVYIDPNCFIVNDLDDCELHVLDDKGALVPKRV